MGLLRKQIRQWWTYRWLHTRSIGVTRTIARRYGDLFGFVYVGGYPKSGTTWVSRLISHYLDLPFPQDYALPPAFRCLIHHHWLHEPAFDRSVYVIRDGRDVMVSEFVSMMRGAQVMRERLGRYANLSPVERALLSRRGRDGRLAHRLERLFGPAFDPWEVERNLPIFLEANLDRPFSEVVPEPWPVHVRQWLSGRRRTVIIRYEELVADGQAALVRALHELLEQPIDLERVRLALGRYDFRQMTGRAPGEEDRPSLLRKGIVGDWRNYFTPRASEVFDGLAGEMLIELGYERDHDWVRRTGELRLGGGGSGG